jgi:plasmid stabilization system protein ParE
MTYSVIWAPEAHDQLIELNAYIATAASAEIAEQYIRSLVHYCDSLNTFPHRGNQRDDIRPGMRITHFRGKTIIGFSVDNVAHTVSILGVFHGGQDYETALRQ